MTDLLNKNERFEEMAEHKICKFYSYQRVVERYVCKEGRDVEYTRTARVVDAKPVKSPNLC